MLPNEVYLIDAEDTQGEYQLIDKANNTVIATITSFQIAKHITALWNAADEVGLRTESAENGLIKYAFQQTLGFTSENFSEKFSKKDSRFLEIEKSYLTDHTKSQLVLNDLRDKKIECIELCALKDGEPVCVARIDHRINKTTIDREDESNAYRLMTLWNEADEKEIATEDLNAKIQFLIEKHELEQKELVAALETLYDFLNDSFSMGIFPISESEFEIEMMTKVDSIINKYKK